MMSIIYFKFDFHIFCNKMLLMFRDYYIHYVFIIFYR